MYDRRTGMTSYTEEGRHLVVTGPPCVRRRYSTRITGVFYLVKTLP